MKKILCGGLFIFLALLGLSLSWPAAAGYTPTVGDLISVSNDSAVYYIGEDRQRHLFVNEATFWTWYSGSWSQIQSGVGVIKTIKNITQDDFAAIPVGSNMTAKPAQDVLIRFENSPKVYWSSAPGKLSHVTNTETANQIFGNDWRQKVITIQRGFESDYTKDGELGSDEVWQDLLDHINTTFEVGNYLFNGFENTSGKTLADWRKTVYLNPSEDCLALGEDECYQEILHYSYGDYAEFTSLFKSKGSAVIHSDGKQAIANYFIDLTYNNFPGKSIITFYLIKHDDKWQMAYNTARQVPMDLVALGIPHDDHDQDLDGWMDNYENCQYVGGYAMEGCAKTDMNNPDTDGDGWWDGIEVFVLGSDYNKKDDIVLE